MTKQQYAEKLLSGLQYVKKDNGEELICIKTEDKEVEDMLLGITFTLFEELSLSSDSAYKFTLEALQDFSDSEDWDEVKPEPDTYNGEHLSWLAESVNHIDYLTQAIEEFQPEDGYALLSSAQYLAKSSAYQAVREHLEKWEFLQEKVEEEQ